MSFSATDISVLPSAAASPTGSNPNYMDFPSATLPELFEKTVSQYPDRPAVRFNGQSLSYGDLNSQANKIADFLRRKGAGPEQLVAIITARSFSMIEGIYGIIKSGAGYLPLSPYDPVRRVQSLVEDAQPVIVLVQELYYEQFAAIHPQVYCIEEILSHDYATDNLPLLNTASDLAYVIYTSGSTGMPKGVMIEHRSVVNRLAWMQQAYPISCEDIILQKTPYTFDVSVWELFWWALQGATVCLPLPNNEKNPMALVKDIEQNKVSVLHFVPSMFNVFMDYIKLLKDTAGLRSMRLVFTSGEALQLAHVKKFHQLVNPVAGARLVNLYGPTEATVDVTHFECLPGNTETEIPIGKAISNTTMYVLKENEEAATGETGELCIAGVGLARGYLNRVELTHEKFAHPFSYSTERVYRTGDLASYRDDGNLLYFGRIDHQVKIRGIRIELGEIDAVLNEYPGIDSCIVDIKRPSENVILLVAFYVSAGELPPATLKAYMKEQLPEYMVPNFFQRLEVMPLTVHGKLNRKELPELSLK